MADLHLLSPMGFRASGVHAGIKTTQAPDVALLVCDDLASAAAAFTTSQVVSAAVTVGKNHIAKGKLRGVVVNSGNANACTGRQGMLDARQTVKTAAMALDIDESEVLVSSTGVIGQFLPMDNVKLGIFACAKELSRKGGADAAEGICTTDTFTKECAVEIMIDGKPVRIGGIAKGSGMIAPNMATMLAFITTDAAIAPALLKKTLRSVCDLSFNRITVDGDTSTNDMAVVLANGASGTPTLRESSADYKKFYAALKHVLITLSKLIVKDGEGATKFVEVTVKGAPSAKDADIACRTVCNSSLVKTAIHGEDANWGRILAAVGRSGIRFNPDKTEIFFGKLRILGKNYDISFSEEKAKKILQKKEIVITVDLHSGSHAATFWTCDLSREYVTINASYRS